MENDMLQGKGLFPKMVADACWILASWKDRYGDRDSRVTESNDGMVFTTISDDKKGNRNRR